MASDSNVLSDVSRVIAWRNGGVLVNDPMRLRLILFDSSMHKFTIVSDTGSASANKYGEAPKPGALIPYLGDSALFVDGESRTLQLIGPNGVFVRSLAPLRLSHLAGFTGAAATDPEGRLILRMRPELDRSGGPFTPRDTMVMTTADSAPILRADFERRTEDTLGFVHVARQRTIVIHVNSRTGISVEVDPLPVMDDWAMLPDGSIAIVRSHDYHIDWIGPGGQRSSSPKMPFDWRRITAEEKAAIVDSTKRSLAVQPRTAGRGQNSIAESQPPVIKANLLPDYFPPVSPGQVRADFDGNVWILPTTTYHAGRGLVYDVVNRQGKLIERVQLPYNCLLVGFGPNGVLYLRVVKGLNLVSLERATVER